jgi:hypothetical protein
LSLLIRRKNAMKLSAHIIGEDIEAMSEYVSDGIQGERPFSGEQLFRVAPHIYASTSGELWILQHREQIVDKLFAES